jgi:transposase
VRFIGLDVHKDFCEVAISDGGKARSAGRVKTTRAELELFGRSLGCDDRVVLEATGNSLAIARILKPHVGEVVIANARKLKAISHAKLKNDRVDARRLAELLAADLVPRVWVPDERARLLRRLTSRRAQLVRHASRLKSHIYATLQRNLTTDVPASDLFGKRGRAWLDALELPADERQTVESDLRRLDFSFGERELLDKEIARIALGSPEIRRLMTIPGVDVVVAATMVAVIGDIARFPSARHLVGYVGLDARVRQSGSAAPRTGKDLKRGGARGAARARRGGLGGPAVARPTAGLRPTDHGPPRPPGGGRGRGAQAVRALLARAQPRRGLRLPPTGVAAAQAAPARAARRGAPTARQALGWGDLGDAVQGRPREGPRPPDRAQLPPAGRRLAGLAAQRWCGRRTGARISRSVKRPSSAAGISPRTCALARGRPAPTRSLAKEAPRATGVDFHR